MKRKILVTAPGVKIVATVTTAKTDGLMRDEVEQIRDALADRLQEAASFLPYFKTPRNRVRVRG